MNTSLKKTRLVEISFQDCARSFGFCLIDVGCFDQRTGALQAVFQWKSSFLVLIGILTFFLDNIKKKGGKEKQKCIRFRCSSYWHKVNDSFLVDMGDVI